MHNTGQKGVKGCVKVLIANIPLHGKVSVSEARSVLAALRNQATVFGVLLQRRQPHSLSGGVSDWGCQKLPSLKFLRVVVSRASYRQCRDVCFVELW